MKGNVSCALQHYIKNIKIGNPTEHRNLRIFPLLHAKQKKQNYITLDEASKNNTIEITELKNSDYRKLKIKNTGKKNVLIIAGEIFQGTTQNRTFQSDILIPANNIWISVPVFCVQYFQPTQDASILSSAQKIIPSSIRKSSTISKNQNTIWNTIKSSQSDDSNITSETQDVLENFKSSKATQNINVYQKAFKHLPTEQKNMIGFAISSGNKIISIEIFENNNVLYKYWDKLLESYATGDLSEDSLSITKQDVKTSLSQIKKAHIVKCKTPGLGTQYKFSTESGKGTTLTYKSSPIHLTFFTGKKDQMTDSYDIPNSQLY
jgi:hypothetical protein